LCKVTTLERDITLLTRNGRLGGVNVRLPLGLDDGFVGSLKLCEDSGITVFGK
jgi:hypothetical protein